jgi:hypothetical protein
MLTASEWPMKTGTRTQVAVTLIFGIEDLLGLGHHLPLFLGVAVLHEHIDVRDDVEGDALGELLRLDLVGDEDALGLREQLVHAFLAGARHRLIGRDDDALDGGRVVQRLQRHDQLRRRAVRVGDDVLLGEAGDRVRVHFRHDQRHVGVVAPGRRIVDDDAALRRRSSATIPSRHCRRPTSGRCRCRRNRSSRAPSPSASCRRRRLRCRLRREASATTSSAGKAALFQNVQHFAAHIARRADDRYLVTHAAGHARAM